MSMPPHKSPRKFFWPLLAGFVVLMVGYFVALGTEIFDIAPEDYPEMRPVGKSGKSVRVAEAFASSPSFQIWRRAHEEAFDQDLPNALEIQQMMLGQNRPEPTGMVAWLFRAHLALLAMEELAAQAWEWDGKFDASDLLAVQSGVQTRHLRFCTEISVLHRANLSSRETYLRSIRAESKLLRKIRECDESMIWLLVRNFQEENFQLSILRAIAHAPWSDNDEILAEFSSMVDLPEKEHVRHLANAMKGDFKTIANCVKITRMEIRADGPWKDWSANNWKKRKERLSVWWAYYRAQPNRVARAFRPYTAHYLTQVSLVAKHWDMTKTHPKASLIDQILPWPEAGGDCVINLGVDVPTNSFQIGFQTLATARLTQTAIALARYRLANDGKLPTSLADLVPKYLPSVPLDPFDGLPLRYDPEKQLLWSIGKDLADDHGGFSKEEAPKAPGAHFGRNDPDLVLELGILFGSRR